MGSSTLQKLSLVCLISSTVPSSSALATAVSAAQVVGLIRREAATCGGVSGLQQCGSNYPSDFCCPSSTTCLQLNNTASTSVICCPAGQDCKFIQPITCDVGQLNATLHPENQIHAANTTGVTLPPCGGSCCPLGYTCSGGMCAIVSSSTSPSSSPTATAIHTGAAASQTAASTPPIPTTAPSSNPAFPARAVVAGFFPGMLLGALLALAIVWFISKRREAARNRYSGDFGHVAHTVSDPIYDPTYAARTDFLRRGSTSAASQPSPGSTTQMVQPRGVGIGMYSQPNTACTNTPAGGIGSTPGIGGPKTPRVRSLFSKSPKLNGGSGARTRDPYTTPTRTPTASTTRSKGKGRASPVRSDSTETIDVLMPAPSFLQPPSAVGGRGERPLTQGTTFTGLMEEAGFSRRSREGLKAFGGR
ncbi:hypothetical protein K432DRAFT_384873 [Lepidopterella palustris CBS 459.81]|uniref:Mid2 domain-containing protein n=1 Tax=Lepidopterella palustris CBS 459.81 TaxID=1314670 RepID=A0A8E2E4F6_9PEZI|nr:hypothetical protein K432DRAFT_384873 [Lepidopterella palustris CBS 459.81]